MKKLLLVALVAIFALAGCGKLEVDVNKDGSAEFTYTVKDTDGLYSVAEIESEMVDLVDDINADYDDEVAKLKKFKEKDGVVTAVISMKNEAFDSEGLILVPVKDMYRYSPDTILALEDADGAKLSADDIEKYEDYVYFYMDNSEFMSDITVNVPGKVAFVEDGTKVSKDSDKTAVSDKSSIGFIYKNSGLSLGGIIIPIVLLVVVIAVAGVAFFLYRKFKGPKVSTLHNGPQTVINNGGGNQNA